MSRPEETAPSRVVLVRHAATISPEVCQGARYDAPLALEGRAGAEELRERLGPVDHVVSSPLQRALETAVLLGQEPVVDPRWSERDFGTWEGQPWQEVMDGLTPAALEDATGYLQHTPDGGEPWSAVIHRVTAALQELGRRPGTSLVVTHGGPIRVAVAHVLGIPLDHAVAVHPAYATSTWLTRVDTPMADDCNDGQEQVWKLDRFGW